MAGAFGFSAGDIVTAIDLGIKIVKALQASSTSSQECTEALAFLQSVGYTVRRVETTYRNDHGITDLEALGHVEAAAKACSRQITCFTQKLEKYNSALMPTSTAARSESVFRQMKKGSAKVKWSLAIKDDVAELRAAISSDLLLMGMFVKLVEAEETMLAAQKHEVLLQRTERIEGQITRLVAFVEADAMAGAERRIEEVEDHMSNDCEGFMQHAVAPQCPATHPDLISPAADLVRSGGVVPTHFWMVIVAYVWQLFQPLIRATNALPSGPTWSLDTNIHVQDALGRTMSLPHVYFRDWPVLLAKLQVDFKGLPGELKVLRANFCVQRASGGELELDEWNWSRYALPGSRFVMAMRIKGKGRMEDCCPRCGEQGQWLGHMRWTACTKCGLQHQARERGRQVPALHSRERHESGRSAKGTVAVPERLIEARKIEEEQDLDEFRLVQWMVYLCPDCDTRFTWHEHFRRHLVGGVCKVKRLRF